MAETIIRNPEWRSDLTEYLASVARVQFKAGKHDCALFVAGAIKSMTGTDFSKGYRGYRTLKAGQAKLAKAGFDDHIGYAAAMLPEVPVLMARAGDVAVVEADSDLALGIVQGAYIYVLQVGGLVIVPLETAKRTFTV